jgi:EAL domain-containing protein (putative c-di-GMP-specific phosphodiesterase class I)
VVVSLADQLEQARRTRTAIEDLIAHPDLLGPDLQPVRRLSDGVLVGHKATGRGRAGTEVGDTLSLLEGAKTLGLVERLDWAFRCHTFRIALGRADIGELHLTPEPETFGAACPPRLTEIWFKGRRELDVVAELHGDAFMQLDALRRACDEMRGWGWRFAVADLADAPTIVDHLAWVRPAYVEVDLTDIRRLDAPSVRAWVKAGRAAGATVLAVNVDSDAALTAARAGGADYARSTHDAPAPQPASEQAGDPAGSA